MTTIPSVPNTGSGFSVPIAASQSNEPRPSDLPLPSSPDPATAAVVGNMPVTQADLKLVLLQANKVLASASSNQLEFSVDKVTGFYVVKLVDQQTGKILRQYPTEKLLAIAQSIANSQGGSLLSQEA